MVRTFCIAGAFIIALAQMAMAADKDFELCQSISRDPAAVAACDRVIASGKLKGENLRKAYYDRGLKHRYHNRYDQAIRDFTQAIKADPKFTWSYVARGHAYAYKKDFVRAFADQETAIRMETTEVTYTGRAVDLIQAGAYDRAIADLDQALRINAKYFYGHLYRGDAYLKKRDFANAEAAYRMALAIRPDDQTAKKGLQNARDRKSN